MEHLLLAVIAILLTAIWKSHSATMVRLYLQTPLPD